MSGRSLVDDLAQALGERFPQLDVPKFRRHPAFRRRGADAIASLGSVAQVVAEVGAYGELRGAANPYGVVVARLDWAVADHAERRQVADDRSEADRWAAVDRAARRGETLRALVARGLMFADEAAEQVAAEYRDPELHAIALAALDGGAS